MKNFFLGLLSLGALLSASAGAAEVAVTATVRSFDPDIIQIQPGDKVVWRQMSSHSTTSIDKMIPDGATPWNSKLGEDFAVTLDKPGAYVYTCTPHASFGMGGVIIVGGKPANLDALKAATDNNGKRWVKKLERYLDEKGIK
jgi:pseudoazurin